MPDFIAAIKGKRTLSSLREAVDSVLTGARIEATQQADLLSSRLAIIDEVAKDHEFLVRDLSALVAMPTETLSAVIKQRIADHKAALTRKADDERIRREAAAPAQKAPVLSVTSQYAGSFANPSPVTVTMAQGTEPRTMKMTAESAGQEPEVSDNIAEGVSVIEQVNRESELVHTSPVGRSPIISESNPPTRDDLVIAVACYFEVEMGAALEWLSQHDWRAALAEAA